MSTKTRTLTVYIDDLDKQEIPEGGEVYHFKITHPDLSTQEFDTSAAGYQRLQVDGVGLRRHKRGRKRASTPAAPAAPQPAAGKLVEVKVANMAYTRGELASVEAFERYLKEIREERGGGRNAYYHLPVSVAEDMANHIETLAQQIVDAAPAGDRTAKQRGHDLRRHGKRIRDQLTA